MKNIRVAARKISGLFNVRHTVPLLICILFLFVTYGLWKGATRVADNALHADFEFRAKELSTLISQRMLTYEQVLRGGVGLFAASHQVTREEFHEYVKALDVRKNYPGVLGIGFALRVPAEQKQSHILEMRNQGFPNYDITPTGERSMYTAIVYLESFGDRDFDVIGRDMFSEPRRRDAMILAMDTGDAIVSGKTRLIQADNVDDEPGFLMYLPVYRNGTLHETLAERRANLVGWLYAPFRMNNLMQGIQGGHDADFDIEIYDGDTPSNTVLMYDSNPQVSALSPDRRLVSIDHLDIGNHRWLLAMTALPAFERQKNQGRARLILGSGTGISILLGMLVWIFLDDRAHAMQAAEQATRLALYDVLTGLPNRKLIDERLQQLLTRAKRDQEQMAILFIDLDKFKPVNDAYGHAVGDLLLKAVAARLQSCMRESDTAARIGGDEFIVLLPEIDGEKGAMTVAQKILDELTQQFDIAGHRVQIAACIGIALYPEHGHDQNTLVKNADQAMYAAKNNGGSSIRVMRNDAV